MRICFLTCFHSSWTDQDVSILRELGHFVFLFYPSEHACKRALNARAHAILLLRCIPACLRSGLIYCWFVFPTGVLAIILGRLFKKPVVLNSSGCDVTIVPSINYGAPARWYLRPFISWALKNATKVISVSRESARWAKKWGGKNVTVIYQATDVGKFKPFSTRETRQKQGYILLTVCPLEKGEVIRKDLKSLMESLPKVIEVFPNVKLVIVGKKGDAYTLLTQIARRLNIENNIIVKGFVSDLELVDLYNQCDIFVLPSIHEAFPTVCAEAQACEKPVISTNTSSMPEVIEDNETGMLVDAKNPEALAQAIIKLLSDPVLRRRLGKSGRQRIVRFFSREVRLRKLQEMLATYWTKD